MTFFVKCNKCGKMQEAEYNKTSEPLNPLNPDTKEKWWSRTIDGKVEHVCSQECLDADGGMAWPKWAY